MPSCTVANAVAQLSPSWVEVPGSTRNAETGMSVSPPTAYRPQHPIRLVTAASLFDGHDAAINIMRRILQASGAEVIHLGHNRSAHEIVDAAIQEDAQGIAVSSYQGGHVDFFKYLVDLLRRAGAGHIQVFGGGGGVIVPAEVGELEAYGVARIYSPEDGARMGLQGIVNDLVQRIDRSRVPEAFPDPEAARPPGRDGQLRRRHGAPPAASDTHPDFPILAAVSLEHRASGPGHLLSSSSNMD